jgi:hypothetical protein
MIHLIGHLFNLPIPKLGKLYRVFEHLFNLIWKFWCTCLGGSCFKCDFTFHDMFDLRSLESSLLYLCRTLLMDVLEGQAHIGILMGKETHKLDAMT